ncbi:hypothetical protein F2Q70_00004629 [Brassica cretica]|uniref:Uncharacterized protein n=1 Tax=Brassica cretica TaxID=69181 RepID=A0A3N6QDB6_BRACR|nr:hypothetical protein F2Q70_00004629 [Brassica cretica]KAF3566868.1 hypothetical protein DY000_02016735 [Brassica cretica]
MARISAYRGNRGELAADFGSGEQEEACYDAWRCPVAEGSSSRGLRLKPLGLLS